MATRVHYLFLLVAFFCLPLMVEAQGIQVTDFAIDEADLTANLAETAVKDQNGHKCALIKVHTSQKGFQFDVGMLGVTKQQDQGGKHPTEIWLYVPAGVKRIDIMHQQLGELRNFDLRQELKSAKTYHMTLRTGKVETIVNPSLQKQFTVFTLEPANASIEVNGEAWEVDSEGRAAKQLPFGTYQYRATAPRYQPTTGQFTVGKQKYTETIKLTPNFSTITFQTPDEAEVWIDGQKRGTGNCNLELLAGEYTVECRMKSHVSTSKLVTVTPNQPRTIELDTPKPIYGILSVSSTPLGAKVFVDGKEVGETPLSLDNVLIGRREVSVSKKGHYAEPQYIDISQESPSALEFAMKKGSAPAKVNPTQETMQREVAENKLNPNNDYLENSNFKDARTDNLTVSLTKTDYDRMIKKSKRLKLWGWIGGSTLFAGGIILGIGGSGGVDEPMILLFCTGMGSVAATSWMLGFLIRSKNLKKKANNLYNVQSAPLYQEEFKFSNGTSLTAGVDWLQDNRYRTYTPGVGLRFNF